MMATMQICRGLIFEGEGGIGLDAYCLVLLTDCNFTGWDTAAVAQNGAWVNAMECTFANNTVGLKFIPLWLTVLRQTM